MCVVEGGGELTQCWFSDPWRTVDSRRNVPEWTKLVHAGILTKNDADLLQQLHHQPVCSLVHAVPFVPVPVMCAYLGSNLCNFAAAHSEYIHFRAC